MAETNSLIRIGIVSDLDKDKRRVRVYFPDLSNMVSDWLFVLQRPSWGDKDLGPYPIQVTINAAEDHKHTANVRMNDWYWMPNVDDKVLVIYTYGKNTDGYVLGVIP